MPLTDNFFFLKELLVENISKTCVYFSKQFEKNKNYAEQKLSQWFWQSISTLPKNYFPKDITQVNYFDKCLWSGIFNESLESLKEQSIKSTERQCKDAGISHYTLLEQLIHLQGIVGKYMLSPICYEEGLDLLKQRLSSNKDCITAIEKVRNIFRSELKEQPALLSECLQGDIIHLFQELHHKNTLTPMVLKNILTYYKPLMAKKSYIKHQNWIKECYNTQSLLPRPILERQKTLSNNEIRNEEKKLTRKCSIRNLVNNLWGNAGKLMSLGLLGQITIIQASGTNITQQNYNSSVPAPKTSRTLYAITEMNQTFVSNSEVNFQTLFLPTKYWSVANKSAQSEVNFKNKYITNNTNVFTKSSNNKINSQFDLQMEINEEMKRVILHQFNKVNNDLKELIGIFSVDKNNELLEPITSRSGLSRINRSTPPFGSRTECPVSKDKVVGLKNTIHDLLSGVKTKSAEDTTCDFNNTYTDQCGELLKLVQCGVNRLKDGFISASRSMSLEKYTKLNNTYNDLLVEIKKVKDKITMQVSQKYEHDLNKLQTDLQELQKSLNNITAQLNEKMTRLCIAEIGHGHIENAAKQFKELYNFNNYILVKDIVAISYTDYGQMDNFDNILNFIQGLPQYSHTVVGYEALYEKMDKNTPKLLVFQMKLEKTMEKPYTFSDRNELSARLNALNGKMTKEIKKIINAWAPKMRQNNCREIVNFANNYYESFDLYVDKLIENAYANNLGFAENIMQCALTFPYKEDTMVIMKSLFKQMQFNYHLDSHQFLTLAYIVKVVIDRPYYSMVSQKYRDDLVALKNSFPSSVRGIIWNGDHCKIKNHRWNEYLYAAADWAANDRLRRSVFTWRPGGLDADGYWKITPFKGGKSFSLKSEYYNNEYLYSPGDFALHTESRRKVFTWRPGNNVREASWNLTPVANCKYFTIKNIHRNEYLYAAADWYAFDNDRRRVFTWTPGVPVTEGTWEISCSCK